MPIGLFAGPPASRSPAGRLPSEGILSGHIQTQAVITKSSGEFELYAVVRASTQALSILALLSDFGFPDMRASVGMDASAAIWIVQ